VCVRGMEFQGVCVFDSMCMQYSMRTGSSTKCVSIWLIGEGKKWHIIKVLVSSSIVESAVQGSGT
jgi:hypothetical protein